MKHQQCTRWQWFKRFVSGTVSVMIALVPCNQRPFLFYRCMCPQYHSWFLTQKCKFHRNCCCLSIRSINSLSHDVIDKTHAAIDGLMTSSELGIHVLNSHPNTLRSPLWLLSSSYSNFVQSFFLCSSVKYQQDKYSFQCSQCVLRINYHGIWIKNQNLHNFHLRKEK